MFVFMSTVSRSLFLFAARGDKPGTVSAWSFVTQVGLMCTRGDRPARSNTQPCVLEFLSTCQPGLGVRWQKSDSTWEQWTNAAVRPHVVGKTRPEKWKTKRQQGRRQYISKKKKVRQWLDSCRHWTRKERKRKKKEKVVKKKKREDLMLFCLIYRSLFIFLFYVLELLRFKSCFCLFLGGLGGSELITL